MKPSPTWGRLAARWLASATLATSLIAHAAAINTGLEALIWPVVILASPFLIVHELLFGSDSGANASTYKEAARIMDAYRGQTPVHGLYIGAVNARWALTGLLQEQRIPFIEVSTAGSAWLLGLAKAPYQLAAQAEPHRYIRLSLGQRGDPQCWDWENTTDDFTLSLPVRPGTCMIVVFDDVLQSDLELRVDTHKLSHRELRWTLVDRASGRTVLSLPFWETQQEGQPLQVHLTDRPGDSLPIARALQTLRPVAEPLNSEGMPRILKRFAEPPRSEYNVDPVNISGELRPLQRTWRTVPELNKQLNWEEAYAQARATGRPVLIGNAMAVLPRTDEVGPACAFPMRRDCDFAQHAITDIGIVTMRYVQAYQDSTSPRPGAPAPTGQNMYVRAAARDLNGKLLWMVDITPASLPARQQYCEDYRRGCYFYPRQAVVTANELIIEGALGADEYELAVPRASIPPVRFRPSPP